MTPKQALDNLYTAARAVSAPADAHDAIKLSYQTLLEILPDQQTGDV